MNVRTFSEQDSSSEYVAKKLGDAKVVKAFNTLRAQALLDRTGQGVTIFYASNFPLVKANQIRELIADAGFVPFDVGPLHEGKKQEPNTDRYLKELTLDQAQQLVGPEASSAVERGVVEERAAHGSVSG
jgi:predicted dinucleotide-binding enzyme